MILATTRHIPAGARRALAVAISFLLAGCSAGGGRGTPRVPIAVAPVESRSVPYEIEATGTVEPLQSAAVTAQASGLITRVAFREGSEVAEGQVLFQVDPRPYQAALAEAEAVVARSRAQAETAQLDAQRAEALSAQDLISVDELQRKRAAATAAIATVSADSAALLVARLNLSHATVRAPIGGRTGSLALHEGDLVRANDITTPLVTINRIRPILVRFTVPQADLQEVRKAWRQAPPVQIAPGEQDSVWISGRLSFVDNAVDAASGTLLLKAEAPNRDGALWPGQFVRVRLQLFEQGNATVVPSAAVTSSQQGTYCYVVKADTTVEVRPVTVQRTWRDMAVIAEGLAAGETIVIDGQIRLSPGARAVIRNAPGESPTAGGAGSGETPQGAGNRKGAGGGRAASTGSGGGAGAGSQGGTK